MSRLTATGAAFAVAPRFMAATGAGTPSPGVLVDGFDAGSVRDPESTKSTTNPNTRRLLTDG